jgi:hypothetical protein
MRKRIRLLIEIGAIYLVVSIALDFFLGSYRVLLWPALAITFTIFGAMILSTIWEGTYPQQNSEAPRSADSNDDLTRLEHVCKMALQQDDVNAQEIISKRIRSLAFEAAAHHLNASEALLRDMAENEPSSLQLKIGDEVIFSALTTRSLLLKKWHPYSIEACLTRIEDWAN